MPKYRAAGITATLQVCDLQQSLPVNIHERHSDPQRCETKRIQTLFSNAIDLQEKPLLEDGSDRPSFLRFVGQRGVLMPLLLCETGQHISTARIYARSELKRYEQISDTVLSPVSDTQRLEHHQELQLSQPGLTVPANLPLTSTDGFPPTTAGYPLLSEGQLCPLLDISLLEDLNLAPRRPDGSQPRQVLLPEGSIGVNSEPKSGSPAQIPTQLQSTQPGSQTPPKLGDQNSMEMYPQALCVTIDLSDKTYLGGKNGGSLKHDGRDFQVEVFMNGELAGSCYVNKRLSGTSAVEMIDGCLVFHGQRIHKQIEAVWIYFPNRTSTNERIRKGESGNNDDSHRQWLGVSESLIAEADSRGWDAKLGLPPPSADFLHGLANLSAPKDLAHKRGLAIIDVIVTAGDGKKLPQSMGHLQEPTSMSDARYNVDNKQIRPVPKISSSSGVEVAETASNDLAEAEMSFPMTTPQPTPVRRNLAMWTKSASILDPTSKQEALEMFSHQQQGVIEIGKVVEQPLERPVTASSNRTLDFKNEAVIHAPSRKRQRLSAVPDESSSPSAERHYWDTVAEFDLSILDPSKFDLTQKLTFKTTRGGKSSTRPLKKRLMTLKQMRSLNRERQVKDIEKALGGSLLDMMYQAVRKDSKVNITGEIDAERKSRTADAKYVPHSRNTSTGMPMTQHSMTTTVNYRPSVFMTGATLSEVINPLETSPPEMVSMTRPVVEVPDPSLLSTSTNMSKDPVLADPQRVSTPSAVDDQSKLAQARASLVLEYGAPPNGYLMRRFLPSAATYRRTDTATPKTDHENHLPSVSTLEAQVMRTRRQSIGLDMNQETTARHGKFSIMAPTTPVLDLTTDNSTNPQESTRTKRDRDTGLVQTDATRALTVEEQFQAISEGFHPPTSSTSIRPFRRVRGSSIIPSFSTPKPLAKSNNRGKALTGTRSYPATTNLADGSVNVPDFVLAMDNFEPPKRSIGSSVGYAEAPTKLFRHIGKARHGEFREDEVVVGFRFCVF